MKLIQRSCVLGVTAPVDELAQILLGFSGVRSDRIVCRQHVDFWGFWGRRPISVPRVHFIQDLGAMPAIASFLTSHVP